VMPIGTKMARGTHELLSTDGGIRYQEKVSEEENSPPVRWGDGVTTLRCKFFFPEPLRSFNNDT